MYRNFHRDKRSMRSIFRSTKVRRKQKMNGILASSGAGGAAGMGSIIIVYAVMIGALWFFLMRPQKKEQKRIQGMLATMEIGDTVLTTSGFYGVIIDISDEAVIVEFGSNKNCRIPMQKSAIAQLEKPGAE